MTHSAGVARAMAEWLVDGHCSSFDLHECDVNRFEPHQLAPEYVLAKDCQNYVEVYDILHPLEPMLEPRPLRTSPFYPRQDELGAYFLEASGWERPQWYEANAGLLDRYASGAAERVGGAALVADRRRRGPGHPRGGRAVRHDGAQAARGHRPRRDGAPAVADHRRRRQVGRVGHLLPAARRRRRHPQRHHGGPARPRPVPGRRQRQPRPGLVRPAPARRRVGGRARHHRRHVLRRRLGAARPRRRPAADASTTSPTRRCATSGPRRRTSAPSPVTALRLSYVGELGWELYTTADLRPRRCGTRCGRPASAHGIIAGGRGAFNSLRLEKGYRSFGVDMTYEHDPYEAGLGFAVKLDKGDFLGRDGAGQALGRAADARAHLPHHRRTPSAVVLGKEPVYDGDGCVGYVTSAAYGYTIGTADRVRLAAGRAGHARAGPSRSDTSTSTSPPWSGRSRCSTRRWRGCADEPTMHRASRPFLWRSTPSRSVATRSSSSAAAGTAWPPRTTWPATTASPTSPCWSAAGSPAATWPATPPSSGPTTCGTRAPASTSTR